MLEVGGREEEENERTIIGTVGLRRSLFLEILMHFQVRVMHSEVRAFIESEEEGLLWYSPSENGTFGRAKSHSKDALSSALTILGYVGYFHCLTRSNAGTKVTMIRSI